MKTPRLIPPHDAPREWAAFLRDGRRFLEGRGYLEVTTDFIVPAGAVEGTIDSLRVVFGDGAAAELHTSPEIEMKGILGRMAEPIYQVAKCFRDDPTSTGIHRKEFTMLEYYRPAARCRDQIRETRALFEALAGRPLPFRETTIRELTREATGLDLDGLRDRAALASAMQGIGIASVSGSDTWDDLFFKLMIERVEPAMPSDIPLVVGEFPLSVSVLAEACPDRFWAERFEIYWHGLELCNGCTELVDGGELRRRLGHENAIRAIEGKAPHPAPTRLLDTLDRGLPACAGVAVGLDRVFACLH